MDKNSIRIIGKSMAISARNAAGKWMYLTFHFQDFTYQEWPRKRKETRTSTD